MPKPVSKKKKFIDPKNERTTTFAVIHRSQKDPLAADDEAPQRLLQVIRESVPDNTIQNGNKHEGEKHFRVQKEEEREFGVFYDDGYDYMQHLKDREKPEYDYSEMDKFLLEKPATTSRSAEQHDELKSSNKSEESSVSQDVTILKKQDSLPSCVFRTKGTEEEVGLLNKAAPAGLADLLEWDPDIVETLDDDFKHDVVLTLKDEAKANDADNADLEAFLGMGVDQDDEYEDIEDDIDSYFSGGSSEADEETEEVADLDSDRFMFAAEETRSRFTAYSMSSSVLTRNNQLRLVDDKFEEFMAEYDDENVGGLELDEIEGVKNEQSEVMKHILSVHQKELAKERPEPPEKEELQKSLIESIADANQKIDIDLLELEDRDKKKEKWDCQSILSTYSNLYNHPKLITEDRIKVSGKTGIPRDILGKGLTERALKKLDRQNAKDRAKSGNIGNSCETDEDSDSLDNDDTRTVASRISAISFRNKHETSEEKQTRKLAVKELKRERRAEKKANTSAFKEEKRKQETLEMNNKKNAHLIGERRMV